MGIRRWWEEERLPRSIDRVMANEITHEWRASTCGPAHGEVVELGFGSGHSLRFYGPETQRVLAVEPADVAWELATARVERSPIEVTRVGLDGTRVDLPDSSADTVVSCWTMCTIPELPAALGEVRRLLRPGGLLRFTEHGLSAEPRVARWQRRLQPWWRPVGGGCHLDRDIPAILQHAGFHVTVERTEYVLPGVSKPFSWFMSGTAEPR